MNIPFHIPYITDTDLEYMKKALYETQLVGNGPYTKKCHDLLEKQTLTKKALLTTSCTTALEMSALLLDIQPGDEFIVPSYTFVSTVNAFVLRGGVPVFVDSREDTLNLDEKLVEQAITKKTKAIVPVHYAGVACEMDTLNAIAQKHHVAIVEDAAQAVGAFYKGKALGTIGDLGAYSFHGTKHIVCGEGGALLVNNEKYIETAEIIREKGTDRSKFLRGAVDKYTWQTIGSSYLPSEITAAFLLSQLEQIEEILNKRMIIWNLYNDLLEPFEKDGKLKRQHIPVGCDHNAHMYYVLLSPFINQQKVLSYLKDMGIGAMAHYAPLHDSPGGKKYGRVASSMDVSNSIPDRIVRLPLWCGMDESHVQHIIEVFGKSLKT